MNDVINRKDAIGAILSVGHIAELSDGDAAIRVSAANYVLRNLPSAQPERKKGQWLRYGEDGYPNNEDTVFWQCDQCLELYTGRAKKIPNFCPNCGADMRGENEHND